MCGISGIITRTAGRNLEKPIRKMMALQRHRGPDDEGIFVQGNIGLGFVRLSILDLTPAGHQPMFSDDGRYVVVYNGEIFNYIELRHELRGKGFAFKTNTDTEVLLAAFQQWGEDCLHRFNGMWAFVIYDRNEKSIFGARDRYGIKPFYYLQTKDLFAFASEIPPLLSLLPGKPTPDNQSIFDYLVFNRTDQTERTFFQEIKKLQHGYSFSLNLDNLPIKRVFINKWYDLKAQVNRSSGFGNPKEFHDLFSSAVGLRLRSDVPVGVCLSGGLDSSSIVSVLTQNFHKYDLNTFSAVYNPGQYGDESAFINLYKPNLHNMHFTTPSAESLFQDIDIFLEVHSEPFPSTGLYAQFKVMELAKDHVVVTLDGQGADELLAGYHYFFGYYFKDLLKNGRLSKLLSEMIHYIQKQKSFYGYKTFLYFLLPKELRTRLRSDEIGYISDDFYMAYASGTEIGGDLYGSGGLQDALLNHFEYKLEHLLKWEDNNSMHFSLEARVPILDHLLVERTLACTNDMVINKGTTKYILREAMKDILPPPICQRTDKIGFGTPQDEWFKNNAFKRYIKEIIKSDSFNSRKIWNATAVENAYHEHQCGQKNNAKEIWKWINLESWYRRFID